MRQGYRVREYVPVGELIPGMAYLVRRLLENTANESFLRLSSPRATIAASPAGAAGGEAGGRRGGHRPARRRRPCSRRREAALRHSQPRPRVPAPFQNEPHADFSREANRNAMEKALGDHRCERRP